MTNMEQPHILYDSQIFDLQKFGGISRYFCEIISKLGMAYDISVRFTENHYLAQAKLAGTVSMLHISFSNIIKSGFCLKTKS